MEPSTNPLEQPKPVLAFPLPYPLNAFGNTPSHHTQCPGPPHRLPPKYEKKIPQLKKKANKDEEEAAAAPDEQLTQQMAANKAKNK